MRFSFYSSLKAPAKRAFDAGTGRHGKFIVDGKFIAEVKKGQPLHFVLVVRGIGEPIKCIPPKVEKEETKKCD